MDVEEDTALYCPDAIPSDRIWFDPLLINSACQVLQREVTLLANVNTQLAAQNVNRWILGLVTQNPAPVWSFGPWPDPLTYPIFISGSASAPLWFTLFNYGPLVSNRWYGNTSFGITIRVVEVIRAS